VTADRELKPPVVLAIETATEACGAAVADGSGVRAASVVNRGLTHSSRLMRMVERLLSDLSVEPRGLDAVAVSVGPGSFTGIRIGMGTALGLATGAGPPLVAVPTLDALAWSVRSFEGVLCPFIDARRGEVYFALYDGRDEEPGRLSGYRVASCREMLDEAEDALRSRPGAKALLAGPVSLLRRECAQDVDPARFRVRPAGDLLPDPAAVAEVGVRLFAKGERSGPGEISPIYVRRSDAELSRKSRRA